MFEKPDWLKLWIRENVGATVSPRRELSVEMEERFNPFFSDNEIESQKDVLIEIWKQLYQELSEHRQGKAQIAKFLVTLNFIHLTGIGICLIQHQSNLYSLMSGVIAVIAIVANIQLYYSFKTVDSASAAFILQLQYIENTKFFPFKLTSCFYKIRSQLFKKEPLLDWVNRVPLLALLFLVYHLVIAFCISKLFFNYDLISLL